jgi:ankyrin
MLCWLQHNITPLHVACKWGKINMVSLLINKGADIEAKTRDGLTPLHCAARSGHDQVVDLLLESKAPIRSKTKVSSCVCHFLNQFLHACKNNEFVERKEYMLLY